jgi:hypothetical protein
LLLSGRIALEPVSVRKIPVGEVIPEKREDLEETAAPQIEKAFFEKDLHWRWILGATLGLIFSIFLIPLLIGVFTAWMLLHGIYQFRVLRAICARALRRSHMPIPGLLALPVALLQFIPRELKSHRKPRPHNRVIG